MPETESSAVSPARRIRSGPTTRALLTCAAFGALGAILLAVISPATGALAAFAPPLYAVVAGMHSVLPFLAGRVLGFRFAATTVACFVGLLAGPFTPISFLVVVPLAVSGLVYDLSLARRGRGRAAGRTALLVAAALSGVALFLVSLPVMSPEHLIAPILLATLFGRLLGQIAASSVAGALAERLRRAGLDRALRERSSDRRPPPPEGDRRVKTRRRSPLGP
ncbi:hypothetical protein [Leifsonia poae]|uniref:hypothetical protein n=1 Tax=Leifsonia poae TaxID=110933 RepID=UPI001CBD930C|nr:hypothetical protein [Leifsonia poae]